MKQIFVATLLKMLCYWFAYGLDNNLPLADFCIIQFDLIIYAASVRGRGEVVKILTEFKY